MFGPLGLTFVNQVKASRTLTNALLPLANALARASGHRQLGLKYDDLSEFFAFFTQSEIQRLTLRVL